MTVGIIGAGIAGLTLGCLLKQRGVECEIFEPVSYTHLTLPTIVGV